MSTICRHACNWRRVLHISSGQQCTYLRDYAARASEIIQFLSANTTDLISSLMRTPNSPNLSCQSGRLWGWEVLQWSVYPATHLPYHTSSCWPSKTASYERAELTQPTHHWLSDATVLTACTYPFVRQYDEHKLQLTSTLHTGNLNFQVEVFEPLHLMNCAVYVDIHTTVTTQAVTSVVKRIFKASTITEADVLQ